jgi:hypothetical protein
VRLKGPHFASEVDISSTESTLADMPEAIARIERSLKDILGTSKGESSKLQVSARSAGERGSMTSFCGYVALPSSVVAFNLNQVH